MVETIIMTGGGEMGGTYGGRGEGGRTYGRVGGDGT